MKYFAMLVCAAVTMIAASTPVSAARVCREVHGRVHCEEVRHSVNAGRHRSSRGSSDSGHGFSGGAAVGGHGGISAGGVTVAGASGDSAINMVCTNVLLGFAYSKCVVLGIANDGYNDVPQGQVIPGTGQVYSRPEPGRR